MRAQVCDIAPRDWTVRKIQDVCSRVTSGGTPSRRHPHFFEGGVWPWVKTQELQDQWLDDTEEHITEEAVCSSSAKVLPPTTVLLALYGATVGQLGLLRRPMTCNQACCALLVDETEANFLYLYYQLLLHRGQLKRLATGAAQQNLSGNLVRAFELPFPQITEQRAIAGVLAALDDKIEQNRRTAKALERLARAVFRAWFVDFEPVKAKAAGATAFPSMPQPVFDALPTRFVDSAIGPVPEGWEVRRLDELLTLQRGFDLPKQSRSDGSHPVLAASGLNGWHSEWKAKGPGVTTGRSGVLGQVFFVDRDFWPLNTSLWVKEYKLSNPWHAYAANVGSRAIQCRFGRANTEPQSCPFATDHGPSRQPAKGVRGDV